MAGVVWAALGACGSTRPVSAPAPAEPVGRPNEVEQMPGPPVLNKPMPPVVAACERATRTLCPTDHGWADLDGDDTAPENRCMWMDTKTLDIAVCRGQKVRVPMYADRDPRIALTWSPPGAVRVTAEGTGAAVAMGAGEAQVTGKRAVTVVIENRSHASARVVVAMELLVFEK